MDREEHGSDGDVMRLGLRFGGCGVRCVCSGKESLGKPRAGLLLLLPWVLGCQGCG